MIIGPIILGDKALIPDEAAIGGDGKGYLIIIFAWRISRHGLYAVHSNDGRFHFTNTLFSMEATTRYGASPIRLVTPWRSTSPSRILIKWLGVIPSSCRKPLVLKRIPPKYNDEMLVTDVLTLTDEHNSWHAMIDWQLCTNYARIKLNQLYPSISVWLSTSIDWVFTSCY